MFLLWLLVSFSFAGSKCLEGCVFVISDYPDCMDHSILDTWIEVRKIINHDICYLNVSVLLGITPLVCNCVQVIVFWTPG